MRAGYDVIAEALGGFMYVNSAENGEPQPVAVSVIDMMAGNYSPIFHLNFFQKKH